MLARALRFVRLPLLLLTIFAVARFGMGLAGVPYAPRGNAMFSIVSLTFISNFYFGALSRKGGFTWGGVAVMGLVVGFYAQILIFLATWLSFAMGIDGSFFRHWDALQVPEGTVVTLGDAMMTRLQGLVMGPIISIVPALIGRSAAALAPENN